MTIIKVDLEEASKTLSQPEVKIHPEFQKWFDPLEEKEFEILEASIIKAGQADMPLVLWNGYLLDGHHRFKICQKHGLPYKVIHKVFEDEEYAEEYALEVQDGRRNITKFKYTEKEIRRSFLKERNEAKERELAGKKIDPSKPVYTGQEKGRTLEKIAEKAGCSHVTAHDYKKIMDAGQLDRLKEESIKKVAKEIQHKEKKEAFMRDTLERSRRKQGLIACLREMITVLFTETSMSLIAC